MRTVQYIRYIRTIAVFIIVVFGFMLWNGMPNKVPLHFTSVSPDSYGSKYILLALFIMPFAGFIPWPKDKPQFRDMTVSEDMKKLLWEDELKKKEIWQTVTAAILCAVFIFLLLLVRANIAAG